MSALTCPRCGTPVALPSTGDDVICGCGFIAYGPYAREAEYLRAGIPAWQARLTELDTAIAAGTRPGTPSMPETTPAPAHAPRGVQQILLAVGAVLLIAGAAAFTAVTWQYLGRGGQTGVLAALIVLSGGIAVFLRRRIPATSTTLSVVALGILLFAVGWAIQTYGDGQWWRLDSLTLTAFAAVTAAVTLVAGRLAAMPVWRISGVVLIPATAGLAMAWVTTSIGATLPASMPTLIGALPLVIVGLLILQGRITVTPPWQRLLLAIFLLALSVIFIVASPWTQQSTWLTWTIAFIAVAALAWSSPTTRIAAPSILGLALGVSAGIAWPSVWFSTAIIIVVIAVGVLVPAFTLNQTLDLRTALIAGVLWFPITVGWHFEEDLRWPIVAVLGAGALSLLISCWRPRILWRLLASLVLAIPTLAVVLTIVLDSTWLETYRLETSTLPIAALILGYGLLVHRWHPTLTSAAWLLPAITVALLPSSVASLADILQPRFYACVGIAVALIVVGAFTRLIGLLAPGAVAVVILAVQPIGFLAQVVPPWVLYTIGGLVLLVIGARFEQVRRDSRRASRWMRGHLR